MLALTCRLNQAVRIGPSIWVTIVRISPGRVVLGIQAPPELRIERKPEIQLNGVSTDVRSEDR